MKDRETKEIERMLKKDAIAKAKRMSEQHHKSKKRKRFNRVPKPTRASIAER